MKGPLALGEGPVGRGDKDHQVAAGHKLLGQLLVAADDGVGARRVHDVDLSQKVGGIGDGSNAILLYLPVRASP